MNMESEYSCAKAGETINNIHHFMKGASRELGINWGQIVILANLASPDLAYVSTPDLIRKTGMDRCWVYRNIRKLLFQGLIDSIKHPASLGRQGRALYTINGKGAFYLTQALMPNGISLIKALDRSK